MSRKVNNESINLKKGYLNVKLPVNAIVGQYKLWSKKWIQFECKDQNNEYKDKISVELSIFRSQKSTNTIYRRTFRSESTAIFRCQSRTQTYAFTLCDHNLAAIHLAATSETESQLWMQWFRNSVWPPNPLMELENSLKGHFYASIIDNENTHRSGLLGAYGYLQLSDAKMVLTHSQTGHLIHEWLLCQYCLQNPFENILQIIRKTSSFSGLQTHYLYCKDAIEVIKRINRKNELKKYVKCEDQSEELSLDNTGLSSLDNKDFPKNFDRNNRKLSANQLQRLSIDCNTFRIRSAKEIPETMLNSSITSANSLTIDSQNSENIYSQPLDKSDSNEDIYEDMDAIYEEIMNQDINENYVNSGLHTNKQLIEAVPELPPKNILRSDPIRIKTRFDHYLCSEADDKQYIGYDMFSKIVSQTNNCLLNTRKLLTKSSDSLIDDSENDVLKRESENHYYEMRPVFDKSSTNQLSDNGIYVDMRSFSV